MAPTRRSPTALQGEGGYVLAMTTNGYVDEIKLLVAVDNEGGQGLAPSATSTTPTGLGLGVQDDLYFLVGLMNSKGRPRREQQHRRRHRRHDKLLCRRRLRQCGEQVRAGGRRGRRAHRTADGFGGPITVSVTMDGDKIAAVEVVSNSETPEISGRGARADTRGHRRGELCRRRYRLRCDLHQQRHYQRRQERAGERGQRQRSAPPARPTASWVPSPSPSPWTATLSPRSRSCRTARRPR